MKPMTNEELLELVVKLHMAVSLAVKKGKFKQDARNFLERMKHEADQALGQINEDFYRYYD
jgi:hypothetical protein